MTGDVRLSNELYLHNRGDSFVLGCLLTFEGDAYFGGLRSDAEYARLWGINRRRVGRLRTIWTNHRPKSAQETDHPSLLLNSTQLNSLPPKRKKTSGKERFKPLSDEEREAMQDWARAQSIEVQNWTEAETGFADYAESTDKLRTRRGWLAQLRKALRGRWTCVSSEPTPGTGASLFPRQTHAQRVEQQNLDATAEVIARYRGEAF